MGQDKIPMTTKRKKFLATYGDLDNSEKLMEILYAHTLQIDKLERIRSNTSTLVWWLIAIPILLTILIFLGAFGSMI